MRPLLALLLAATATFAHAQDEGENENAEQPSFHGTQSKLKTRPSATPYGKKSQKKQGATNTQATYADPAPPVYLVDDEPEQEQQQDEEKDEPKPQQAKPKRRLRRPRVAQTPQNNVLPYGSSDSGSTSPSEKSAKSGDGAATGPLDVYQSMAAAPKKAGAYAVISLNVPGGGVAIGFKASSPGVSQSCQVVHSPAAGKTEDGCNVLLSVSEKAGAAALPGCGPTLGPIWGGTVLTSIASKESKSGLCSLKPDQRYFCNFIAAPSNKGKVCGALAVAQGLEK